MIVQLRCAIEFKYFFYLFFYYFCSFFIYSDVIWITKQQHRFFFFNIFIRTGAKMGEKVKREKGLFRRRTVNAKFAAAPI